jgi:hypothetical protein
MAGSSRERAEEMKLLRRRVAEARPETPSRESVLRVLDAISARLTKTGSKPTETLSRQLPCSPFDPQMRAQGHPKHVRVRGPEDG